jgi:PAS domain S-box-containing protein
VNDADLASALLAATGDGVFAFDRALVCTHWGGGLERLFGAPADAIVGRPILPVVSSAVDAPHEAARARVLAGEPVFVEEAACTYHEARAGSCEVRLVPWRDAAGRVTGGVGVLRDTSRRVYAEKHASETESRFRIMADVAPVLLWMAGTDGLCTFFNQTWLSFTGRTLEDEWGVGWAEGVWFEDLQRCLDTYMAAFSERRVFEMEYRLRRADGQYRWILDRGSPRYAPDGRFEGFIGSCIDITDMKDLQHDLVRAVRVRDEFLSVASHELRTPLTALRLQLDSVARSIQRRPHEHLASGQLAERAGYALDQLGRLTTLVERLLDISRLAEGRLRLDLEEIDLVDVVTRVVEAMREPARLAGSDLALSVPSALRGRWDRVRVEQVITNLVANAMKFGQRKPIEISVADGGTTARVEITDHGIGIDPQHQQRIFGRFERGVSTRHFGGLGLGLWVAKQIVDAHAGTISVASVPGAGATFTVALPLEQEERP